MLLEFLTHANSGWCVLIRRAQAGTLTNISTLNSRGPNKKNQRTKYRRTGFNCENLIIVNCEFF